MATEMWEGGGGGVPFHSAIIPCKSQSDSCQLPWRPSLPPPRPAMSTEFHTGDFPQAACGRGRSGAERLCARCAVASLSSTRESVCSETERLLLRFCYSALLSILDSSSGVFPAADPISAFALPYGCFSGCGWTETLLVWFVFISSPLAAISKGQARERRRAKTVVMGDTVDSPEACYATAEV